MFSFDSRQRAGNLKEEGQGAEIVLNRSLKAEKSLRNGAVDFSPLTEGPEPRRAPGEWLIEVGTK